MCLHWKAKRPVNYVLLREVTCGYGEMLCTNGVYVLTDYVLSDKICMEVTTFRPGLEISYVLAGFMYQPDSY